MVRYSDPWWPLSYRLSEDSKAAYVKCIITDNFLHSFEGF